jgi:serine/threonine-protein kinase
MGEVYQARDSKLNRDVAVKILPEAFATDPERLARFRREAQVLASLNHPHIGAIYGFEESNGVGALVLEMVEGPTLADRIARGPIPLEEAIAMARQITDACEAAHAQGIIHRDLKPSNIKLRPDGVIKVLDFGLARAADATTTKSTDASQSPTITSPSMTRAGVILGTAAYMSPEQAKGRVADERSDIWSFGCVLFEMLTGNRVFGGEDVAETLALILTKEPEGRCGRLLAVPNHRAAGDELRWSTFHGGAARALGRRRDQRRLHSLQRRMRGSRRSHRRHYVGIGLSSIL